MKYFCCPNCGSEFYFSGAGYVNFMERRGLPPKCPACEYSIMEIPGREKPDTAINLINGISADISRQLPVSNFRGLLEQKLEALRDAVGRGIE
jgi:NAD-dependent SIR2 family protein deacetylase